MRVRARPKSHLVQLLPPQPACRRMISRTTRRFFISRRTPVDPRCEADDVPDSGYARASSTSTWPEPMVLSQQALS
jgi:hypothetical protein